MAREHDLARLILITGCSGGGKSTLLDALRRAGQAVVPEPGRRIVAEERARGGSALPWLDMGAFARRAVEVARADLCAAKAHADPHAGWVFFDRGLIDAAVALEHAAGVPVQETLGAIRQYDDPVFLAPPWPELYAADAERRHGFAEAEAEFERLERALDRLGYEVRLLPKAPVEARVAFVLDGVA